MNPQETHVRNFFDILGWILVAVVEFSGIIIFLGILGLLAIRVLLSIAV